MLDQSHYDCKPVYVSHNKAIRLLIEHVAKSTFSPEVGLVICLLFACVKVLQPDAKIAFVHIRSGLDIVQELRQGRLMRSAISSAKARQISVSARRNMLEQILVPFLTHALASIILYGGSLAKGFVFLELCPWYFTGAAFASVGDARFSCFDLRSSAFMIARDMAVQL